MTKVVDLKVGFYFRLQAHLGMDWCTYWYDIMPKVKEGSKYHKKYTENDNKIALNAIKNGVSKNTASKMYGVPRATIQFRVFDKLKKNSPWSSIYINASWRRRSSQVDPRIPKKGIST